MQQNRSRGRKTGHIGPMKSGSTECDFGVLKGYPQRVTFGGQDPNVLIFGIGGLRVDAAALRLREVHAPHEVSEAGIGSERIKGWPHVNERYQHVAFLLSSL